MRWLVGLALGAHATVITHLDGSVEEIASTTRKHFGRRTIDLDIAGAPLVVVATSEPVEPDAAGFRDAVVLLEQRPPWCDLGDYRALVKAGARAVIKETVWTPGCVYAVRDDAFADMRGQPVPWLDVHVPDFAVLRKAMLRNESSITLRSTHNPWQKVRDRASDTARPSITPAPVGRRPHTAQVSKSHAPFESNSPRAAASCTSGARGFRMNCG